VRESAFGCTGIDYARSARLFIGAPSLHNTRPSGVQPIAPFVRIHDLRCRASIEQAKVCP
jgi:hypothetical protein